jgi:heme-degrading monooxygenase HmoA
MESLAENLTPPYYTAVLNKTKGGLKDAEHVAPSDEMVTIATRQPGFLGLETTRDKKGEIIMVSYWRDVDAIEGWINVGEININQRFGVGLANACGIEISLVEENQEDEAREGGPRGVGAFLMASLVRFLP